jgi:chitinase
MLSPGQPYLYNQTAQIWVSYDDPASMAFKGQYIKQTGLLGFGMFEAGGDYKNLLLNAIRGAVGLN